MLKILDVNDLNEGNLEFDSRGRFSQIKLHILVVRKTLTQRTSHIQGSDCNEKDLQCRIDRKYTGIKRYRKL